MTKLVTPSTHELTTAINACRTLDRFKLFNQFKKLRSLTGEQQAKALQRLVDAIWQSQAVVQARADTLPKITFSDALPINQRRGEIAQLIQDHQVVVIAGETGSGKTTQIPKICLDIGLGNKGLIGHTQPRRIAARTVGKRIAEELSTEFGDVVGYQVRFAGQLSDNTRVKLMTDGVLLSEFQHDKFLNKYEVIIIDEAHERSLNIDFLLGLLKQLVVKRKDLKVIITSATIDVDKFSKHFDNAPVIEVSGRTYPVEVLYQPVQAIAESAIGQLDASHKQVEKNATVDLHDAITATVRQILDGEARGEFNAQGDILVFCAGEREIRDTAKVLHDAALPLEILPLYSRLDINEQNKVFKPAQYRKVVLATNVAETSITVPGIAYVIDPGVARISRYSFKSKVQGLQIELISQASANQRMGRCGRVANGVCIRLYSEDNFLQRPAFTEAELLRSNLAAVILQLLQLKVHDIESFPFLDAPDKRLLNDGFKLLEELRALKTQKGKKSLTNDGRLLAQLPVDPKYGRILLEANKLHCLRELVIVVAALSIQDPREFPADKQQAAREKHKLFQHPTSDFWAYLSLWCQIEKQRKALTNKQFKAYCQTHFLSIMRIFEWRDLVRQLSQFLVKLGWELTPFDSATTVLYLPKSHHSHSSRLSNEKTKAKAANDRNNDKAHKKQYDLIHQALLTGLLGNIAIHDQDNTYIATRGRYLAMFPASVLATKISRNKKQAKPKQLHEKPKNPKWVMANELIETSRLFAHTAAEIEPEWVHKAGQHLLRYSYSSPNYHERAGAVKALRKATLYGLTLRDNAAVIYSDIAPHECRELFIQRALVEGAYARHPQYNPVQHNAKRGVKNEIERRAERDIKNSSKAVSGVNFYAHNLQLIQEIELVEAKTRKRNLLVADADIYQLYDVIIPGDIVNWVMFEQWRKRVETTQPDILKFSIEQLTLGAYLHEPDHLNKPASTDNLDTRAYANTYQHTSNKNRNTPRLTGGIAPQSDTHNFPNHLNINGKDLSLTYHFDPSDPRDGLTLELPIALLEPFPEHIGDWLVPGLLREKCIALIKTLPKSLRKNYAPAANAVDQVFATLQPMNRALHSVLGEQLKRAFGKDIPEELWQLHELDNYYKLNYQLTDSDADNTLIQQSRNLLELKQAYKQYVADSLKIDNAPERKRLEIHNIQRWDFGELAEQLEYQHQGMTVRAYPMLKVMVKSPEKQAVSNISLLLHESPHYANYFTQQALGELALEPLKQTYTYLKKEIFKSNNTSLQLLPLAGNKIAQTVLAQSLIKAALQHCCFADQLPRTANEFADILNTQAKGWIQYTLDMEAALIKSAQLLGEIRRTIANLGNLSLALDEVVEDIKAQLDELFVDGFLHHTPLHQLKHYSRYLTCIQLRLEKLGQSTMVTPAYFSQHLANVEKAVYTAIKQARVEDDSLKRFSDAQKFIYQTQPTLKDHRIMLEEWRVSIFAQQLRTQYAVSEKRVLKHWETVKY